MAAAAPTKLRAGARPYVSFPRPFNHLQQLSPHHLALPFPVGLATCPCGAPGFLVTASAPQPGRPVYGFIQPGILMYKQPQQPAGVNLDPLQSSSPPPPQPPLSSNEPVVSSSSASTAQASSPTKALSSPPTSPPVQASSPAKDPSSPPTSPPVRPLSPKVLPLPPGAGVEDDEKEKQAVASEAARPMGRGRPRQVVGPGISPDPAPATSAGPVFTTPPRRLVPAPQWQDRDVTTVMIRNIPNKLTPADLIVLLDDHCARANKRNKERGAPLAAYDFIYLLMDFSLNSSNMGYAFVNLTTKEAALGLYYALHASRWKVNASKKVVHICPARMQGKKALVKHFSGSTFACRTAEFLPAVFTPPRDGAADTVSATFYVGTLVPPRPPPSPRPAPAETVWKPKPGRSAKKHEEASSKS